MLFGLAKFAIDFGAFFDYYLCDYLGESVDHLFFDPPEYFEVELELGF